MATSINACRKSLKTNNVGVLMERTVFQPWLFLSQSEKVWPKFQPFTELIWSVSSQYNSALSIYKSSSLWVSVWHKWTKILTLNTCFVWTPKIPRERRLNVFIPELNADQWIYKTSSSSILDFLFVCLQSLVELQACKCTMFQILEHQYGTITEPLHY